MDIIKAIKTRRSIREFQRKKPTKKQLKDVLELARFSPSANNRQPWRLVIIENEELLKEIEAKTVETLAFKYPQYSLLSRKSGVLHGAPLLLLICGPKDRWAAIDCVLAAYTLMLVAPTRNLGTCWMGLIQEFLQVNGKIRKKIGIPKELDIYACLAMGLPLPGKRAMPLRYKPRIIKKI